MTRTIVAPGQQPVIPTVFEISREAVARLTHLAPDLDPDRTEYALAGVLLAEASEVGR